MQLLYGISFTINMNKKSNNPDEHIDGYFDYTVPPLEGLWSMEKGVPGVDYTRKTDFYWTSMIRLPEFVTDEVFAWAKASFASKHPEVDINRAYLFDFDEGVVAQVMHKGPYDDEPATVTILDGYARSQGYGLDFSDARRHHEIYLSDPRRAKPENLKTIIRHPVVKVGGLSANCSPRSPRSSVTTLPESLPGSKSATKNSISKITRSTGSSRRDSARATL